jgi:hypothetical protein
MTQLRSAAPLAASAVLALALLVTGRASANECSTSADCDKGFECQEVGVSDCTAPAPDCPPNTDCKPAAPEPCAPQALMECVPAACNIDSDCGAGMVCHDWTQVCPSVGCACPSNQPDCSCDVPACEPSTEKLCTPKYVLPCTAAADCGTGFTCEEIIAGSCSGSSGSGGGADPVPPSEGRPLPPEGAAGAPADVPAGGPLPPDCTSEPTGEFMCVPQRITCDSDAECLAGWTCVADGNVSAPACDGGDCFAAPEPDPQPVTNHCEPKYYRGGVAGVDDDFGTPTSGGPKGEDGGAQNPEAASNGDADANDSSACQMGRAPASRGVLGIALMLGALFGLSRRRAQPRA